MFSIRNEHNPMGWKIKNESIQTMIAFIKHWVMETKWETSSIYQVVVEEKSTVLRQTRLECEMLHKKLDVVQVCARLVCVMCVPG